MNIAWKALLILGAFLVIGAFGMDTTVPGFGGQRVYNIGLQGQQQMLLILGCVLFLAGIALFSVVKLKQTPEQEEKSKVERAQQRQRSKDGLNTVGEISVGILASLIGAIGHAWAIVRRRHVLFAVGVVMLLTLFFPPFLGTDYINGGIKFDFVMRLPFWATGELLIGRLVAELVVEAMVGAVAFAYAKK